MKNKEAQKDVNVIANTFPNISLNQIASYYYLVYEISQNPEQYGIYLNQMIEKE